MSHAAQAAGAPERGRTAAAGHRSRAPTRHGIGYSGPSLPV